MRRAVAAVGVVFSCTALGCAAKSAPAPPPTPIPAASPVAIPTVPPRTPMPEGAVPLPTRPILDEKAAAEGKRQGKAVGPVITFAGVARADGQLTEPIGKNAQGYPVYRHPVGSGFMIVVEAKPGIGKAEVGRSIFKYTENDPTQRPDLEIQVNRPLGNGSATVCDQRRPEIGGIPAINPPSFAETPQIAATLNDFSCRFETFIESNASCTVKKSGDFSFAKPDSAVQFCMVVARAWNFPEGDTLVTMRLRDVEGNPGPPAHFVLQRKELPSTPARALPTPTPTAPRRRP